MRAESQFLIPVDITACRVAIDFLLLLAADQAVDRQTQRFAFSVPECQIDGADGVGREAGSAIGLGQAEHHIRQSLDSEAILPEHLRSQMIINDRGYRPAVAGRAQADCAIFQHHFGEDTSPTGLGPQVAVAFDMGKARHGIGDFVGGAPGRAVCFGPALPLRQIDANSFDTLDFHRAFLCGVGLPVN